MSRLSKWLRDRRSRAQGIRSDDPFVVQAELLKNRSAPVIFDVGAHYGETARRYHNRFPNAEIHCFEPTPASFERLERETAALPRVRRINLGLADSKGRQTFHLNQLDGTNSLLPRPDGNNPFVPEGGETIKTVELLFTTLDDYCAENAVETIDVLKLDIQGAESLAFQGGKRALTSGVVRLIFSEVMFVPLYEGAAMAHELTAHLAELGFRLFNFFQLKTGDDGQLRYGNGLFVRADDDAI